MLNLFTNKIVRVCGSSVDRLVGPLTTNALLPLPARDGRILLIERQLDRIPDGFAACFVLDRNKHLLPAEIQNGNVFILPDDQCYLADGDVVRFDGKSLSLRSIYRRKSRQNSLLVTERCNNFCLMCSQPPKKADDSWIVEELLEAIPFFDRGTTEIGITGGEPTLLGKDFITLLRTLKNYLPQTAVHVLSNGRTFKDFAFAQQVAEIGIADLMIGIPVYSDVAHIHDYVVQAEGAFDETIRGILNLKRAGVKIEIRVVIHKQTFSRLPQLAEFFCRNLLFVDHVALMGLEMMGFTKHNLEDLWIDPVDYQPQLVDAVEMLARYKMNVSVYNHQLCVLDKKLWEYSRKSISDWKNEYMPECSPCTKQEQCGGFFSSARLRYSSHIKPFSEVLV